MATVLKPCVFFDRDGIVNVAPPPDEYYVLSVARFFLIPEFLEALKIAAARGYASVIVTNQKCVAKGLLTTEGLDAIHAHLRQRVSAAGQTLHAIYACPPRRHAPGPQTEPRHVPPCRA